MFTTASGMPITQYLDEDHQRRKAYGFVEDPTPGKGRALKHHLEDLRDE